MERFLSSCHSYDMNSLDWAESEVGLQSSVSIVGDSQCPLSFRVCPDSQDTGVRCVPPDRPSPVNSLENSGTAESLDVEQWDLADGQVKSQRPGSRLGHARTILCPPPSLDTQEFDIRCIQSEELSSVKDFESEEKLTLYEMECWDLADGETISQDPVRRLREAETLPCPPASLDTQEFMRCVEQDRIISMKSEVHSEGPLPDSLEVRNLADGEARPGDPLKELVGKNMSLCPSPPINGQDLGVKLSRQEDVSSMDSLQLTGLAPGEEKSQMPVRRFYCDTETQPRLEYSLTWQDVEDTGVSTKDVLVQYSAYSEHSGLDVRPDTSISRAQNLVLKTKFSATGQDEVHASNPASSFDAPLTTEMPGNNGKFRQSKRKKKDISLSSENKTLATIRQFSHKTHPSILKSSSPACRSPLAPLSVNPMFITDEHDKEVHNANECHRLMVLTSEAEDLENRDPGAVPELCPSRQVNPSGNENVEFQISSREGGAALSTTSTTHIEKEPKSNTDAKRGSSDQPRNPFQSSTHIHIHEVRPTRIIPLVTNTLDKKSPCSVQTQLSSHVGFTSYPSRTKELVPEDHEQSQGWLCPKASKRLLSKKPKQGFLDGWLQ